VTRAARVALGDPPYAMIDVPAEGATVLVTFSATAT
jgi:hypothetical protein